MEAITKTEVNQFKTIGVYITLIGLIVSNAYLIFQKYELTFDDQKQKHGVIELLEKEDNISAIEASKAIEHIHNEDVHMDFSEKARIIRIEENQKNLKENQIAIGGDLAEIKGILKQIKDE